MKHQLKTLILAWKWIFPPRYCCGVEKEAERKRNESIRRINGVEKGTDERKEEGAGTRRGGGGGGEKKLMYRGALPERS